MKDAGERLEMNVMYLQFNNEKLEAKISNLIENNYALTEFAAATRLEEMIKRVAWRTATKEYLTTQAAEMQFLESRHAKYGSLLRDMGELWEADAIRKSNDELQKRIFELEQDNAALGERNDALHQTNRGVREWGDELTRKNAVLRTDLQEMYDRKQIEIDELNAMFSAKEEFWRSEQDGQAKMCAAKDAEIDKLQQEVLTAKLDLDIQADANDHLTLQADNQQRKEDIYCAVLAANDLAHPASTLRGKNVTSLESARALALACGVPADKANEIN